MSAVKRCHKSRSKAGSKISSDRRSQGTGTFPFGADRVDGAYLVRSSLIGTVDQCHSASGSTSHTSHLADNSYLHNTASAIYSSRLSPSSTAPPSTSRCSTPLRRRYAQSSCDLRLPPPTSSSWILQTRTRSTAPRLFGRTQKPPRPTSILISALTHRRRSHKSIPKSHYLLRQRVRRTSTPTAFPLYTFLSRRPRSPIPISLLQLVRPIP